MIMSFSSKLLLLVLGVNLLLSVSQVPVQVELSYPERVKIGDIANITVTVKNTWSSEIPSIIICDNVTHTCRFIGSLQPGQEDFLTYQAKILEPGMYTFYFSVDIPSLNYTSTYYAHIRGTMYNSLLPVVLFSGPLFLTILFYKRRSRIFFAMAVIGMFLWVLYGVWSMEHSLILRFSTEICLSCLGLEAEERAIKLSPESEAKLKSLESEVHIILFTSEHCKACPAAKHLLSLVSNASEGMVKYVELDIATHKSEAEEYGVRFVPTIIVGNVKIEGVPSDKYLVDVIVKEAGGG